MLSVGAVVDGKYKILNEIGRGGMSIVYLAINERANKTWAIKEVRKDGGNDSQVAEQNLVAETDILKMLNHPNLPSIIDVIDQGDTFLIVMDYIEGRSLESVLNHNGPQKKDDVIKWARQLCDVLGYLHSQQPEPIIYRDMKPANVMLRPSGDVTLIDFGTARKYKGGKVEDTKCLGTEAYAAPEQFGRRGESDARTDIYCLGATMYHLLTGYSKADTQMTVYPVGQINPELSGSGIEYIVAKCCEPVKEDRYQTCDELMYDLEHEQDLNRKSQRARKMQLYSFAACLVLMVISLIGMAGFKAAANAATSQSYENYIYNASRSDDLAEAQKNYLSAISLQPGTADAYESLLDWVQQIRPEQGEVRNVVTQEEYTMVQSCVNENNGTNRANIDYLRDERGQAFADFSYRWANNIYFFYDGSDNRIKASKWYGEILESEFLSSQELEVANALYEIGEYYEQLFSSSSSFLVDSESSDFSFVTLWTDLDSITRGDVLSRIGKANYAVGLYEEMVNQIYSNALYFRRENITQEQMTDKLNEVESGLYTLEAADSSISGQIEKVRLMIVEARRQVQNVFATVGG